MKQNGANKREFYHTIMCNTIFIFSTKKHKMFIETIIIFKTSGKYINTTDPENLIYLQLIPYRE